MDNFEMLNELRNTSSNILTVGLADEEIKKFIDKDDNLKCAITCAFKKYGEIKLDCPESLALSESDQIKTIQDDFVNFYDPYAVNPYIPLAAKGPWIVTSCGAILHDSGGYGMLGFGHAPDEILEAMNKEHVMANIMTANYTQKQFTETLKKEIGHSRNSQLSNPYKKFMCLNSGSEAVTIAARISDLNAANLTKKGGEYEGREIKFLALKGSFHGRTDRPAQFSDSCLKTYRAHLASFKAKDNLITIEANNLEELTNAFSKMDDENIYFEAMFMEPVMGEGNPGLAIDPEFYKLARELCTKYKTLLVIDSIQAGLRAQGCLSIVDYPGFENLAPPDMETYSKALNAGQYPLSIIALGTYSSQLYTTGIYGNTMTSNPRALDVAIKVLKLITPELRKNIVDKGKEFLTKLNQLKDSYPTIIKSVQGTGLLFAVEITEEHPVIGVNGLELCMRKKGIGVIHGGKNALRFTPHFKIESNEIDLIISKLEETFKSLQ